MLTLHRDLFWKLLGREKHRDKVEAKNTYTHTRNKKWDYYVLATQFFSQFYYNALNCCSSNWVAQQVDWVAQRYTKQTRRSCAEQPLLLWSSSRLRFFGVDEQRALTGQARLCYPDRHWTSLRINLRGPNTYIKGLLSQKTLWVNVQLFFP